MALVPAAQPGNNQLVAGELPAAISPIAHDYLARLEAGEPGENGVPNNVPPMVDRNRRLYAATAPTAENDHEITLVAATPDDAITVVIGDTREVLPLPQGCLKDAETGKLYTSVAKLQNAGYVGYPLEAGGFIFTKPTKPREVVLYVGAHSGALPAGMIRALEAMAGQRYALGNNGRTPTLQDALAAPKALVLQQDGGVTLMDAMTEFCYEYPQRVTATGKAVCNYRDHPTQGAYAAAKMLRDGNTADGELLSDADLNSLVALLDDFRGLAWHGRQQIGPQIDAAIVNGLQGHDIHYVEQPEPEEGDHEPDNEADLDDEQDLDN